MSANPQLRKQVAWLIAALVAVSVLIGIVSTHDVGSGFFAVIGTAFVIVGCVHQWYLGKKLDVTKMPPTQRIRVLKTVVWMLGLLGPVLGVYTYLQLEEVKRGAEPAIPVWEIVALIYRTFGFWPAVLVWPVISVGGVTAACLRIRQAQAELATEDA